MFRSAVKHNFKKNDTVNIKFSDDKNINCMIVNTGTLDNKYNDRYFSIQKEDIIDFISDGYKPERFSKVVSGFECEYYFRKFKKIINNITSDIPKSNINKLAFTNTIYGDEVSQIVYTDDIDIANLRDNLGRPLSSIYLTFFKNNSGYKQWYGVNGYNDISSGIASEAVEYSHCFGKLNCAFRLSNESIVDTTHQNSICINNIDSGNQYKGLDMFTLNNNRPCPCPHDEIHYDKCPIGTLVSTIDNDGVENMQVVLDESGEMYVGDRYFYGDLCAYSSLKLEEKSIQQIEFRFNTAQRESNSKYFQNLIHHEIVSDDYDLDGFVCSSISEEFKGRREGYVYHPHFEIPIRTFDNNVKISKPIYLIIEDMKYRLSKSAYTILTTYPHHLSQHDKVTLKYGLDYYYGDVIEITNDRTFICNFNKVFDSNTFDYTRATLFTASNDTPSYATLSKEGSCYYMWKEIINNGWDTNSDIEIYPFVNGAFYINKNINLFVKRQDPNDVFKLEFDTLKFDPKSETYEQRDTYYEEEDITC
jgi:hypothetical protein